MWAPLPRSSEPTTSATIAATMDPTSMRRLLAAGQVGPAQFRAALTDKAPSERDGWVDAVFGLDALPDDGPELPRGCVPYLPSPVHTLLTMIDIVGMQP